MRWLLTAGILLSLTAWTASNAEIKIDPLLLKKLAGGDEATVLVYLDERADLSRASAMDWQTRGRYVHRQLTETAERSQAPLRAWLDDTGAHYQAFWIANVIVVEQADLAMLNTLKTLPGVRAIRGESGSRLMVQEGGIRGEAGDNITHIGAPEVWAQGVDGEGMTIGIIDSGVRHTHEALVEQYRGRQDDGSFEHDYNWFDPGGSEIPIAAHPHGTHVIGSAVGDGGIGVAPGAKWIACLGCPGDQCPDDHLLQCGQFMLTPDDPVGTRGNSDLRPHVVNNSWGDCENHYDGWYQQVVDAWVDAGMVPVFSNGNATSCNYAQPPGLDTVGNPARYGNVLGIGSTGNSDGQYAAHSNWGPTDHPNPGLPDAPDHFGFAHIKPNVVAPGVNIRSSVSASDSSYQSGWTGTSMSAAHASGVIALMWSAAPCLKRDFATTGTILMQTARAIAFDSAGEPPPGPGNIPNYATGWGEIDAPAAVAAAQRHCTPGFDLEVLPEPVSVCTGEAAQFDIGVAGRQDFKDPVTLAVADGLPPGAQAQFSANPVIPANPAAVSVLAITDTGDAATGDYVLEMTGVSDGPDAVNESAQTVLQVVAGTPQKVNLQSPANGAGDQHLQPNFAWQASETAAGYRFQLAENADFSEPLIDEVLVETAFSPATKLVPARLYYWRVAAINACGESEFSRMSRFITAPVPGQCPLGTTASTVFDEGFTTGQLPAAWQTGDEDTPPGWTISDSESYQAGHAAFAQGVETPSDQRLTTPAIALPTGSERILLNFHSWQWLEAGSGVCFDGGLVEISGDGGERWTQLRDRQILTPPYDGTIAPDFLNPLAGRRAWCGNPRDFWERYSLDLSHHAGHTVQLRFRFGTDNAIGGIGWYIDALEVKACFNLFQDRFEGQ